MALLPLVVLLAIGIVGFVCFADKAGALDLGEQKVALRLTTNRMAGLLYEDGDDTKAARVLNADEETQYNALEEEAKGLRASIEKAEAAAETAASRGAALAANREFLTVVPPHKSANTEDPKAAVTKTHENVEDDLMRGYKTPRAYIMDVLRAGRGAAPSALLKPLVVQATAGSDEQGVYSDPYGGFAVPPGMSPDLLKTANEGDVLGQYTRQVPMAVAVLPFLARVDKDHSSSVSGGFRWYWGSEADEVAASRGEIEKVTLTAHTAKGHAFATNELLTDSPMSFAALIADGFSEEYASFMAEARLNGTGLGQPAGINGSACVITITKEAGQVADTIVMANILKMVARCWGFDRAIWVTNQTVIPQLGTLTIDNGASVVPMFLPSAREGMPETLMGRPIIYTEHAPALGDAGDLSLYNMNEYLEGTLQTLQGRSSIHVRFLQNTSTFQFTARKAGAPWWRSALTPKNGDTLSPAVRLGAR